MIPQHVTVTGRNMDVGEVMTDHVRTQMATLSQKYFGRLVTCRVVFTKQNKGRSFTCNIGVSVAHDMHYDGEAEFDDVRICFNRAYEHVAKQLRRTKRALHEDKPNGHMKEQIFNELSRPDVEPVGDIPLLPIDGNDLSIDDVRTGETAKVVARRYNKA
jgi:ribosomal subunit interface protein